MTVDANASKIDVLTIDDVLFKADVTHQREPEQLLSKDFSPRSKN